MRDIDLKTKAKLRRRATYAAISVSVSLIIIKLVAWALSDSVAILSSLIDSALDAITSVMIFIAVRKAEKPADKDHRFGHGKAEPIASLLEGAFIGGSALMLIIASARRFFDPIVLEQPALALIIMVISMVLTGILVSYQSYVVHRTDSLAIRADLAHYKMDILVNLGVILTLVITQYVSAPWLDPLAAILISSYLIFTSSKIIRNSMDQLMDKESVSTRNRIIKILEAHPEVIDFHDLRTRKAGTDIFIEMHLEMNGSLPLREAHMVTEDIEREISRAFKAARVLIHQEPAGIQDERDEF